MSGHREQATTHLSQLGTFAASGLLATGLLFALRLAKNVLFTRLLGPEGRGVYGLLMTVPTLVVSFGNLGFGLGSVYLAAKKKADPRALLGNILAFALVHGGVLCLVGVGLYRLQAAGLLTLDGADTIHGFVLASIPLLLFHNLGIDLLMAYKAIHFLNVLKVVFSTLPMAVMLGLFLLTGDTLTASLYSWPVSLAVVGILAFGRLRGLAGGPPRVRPALAGQALRFGLRGTVSQFANSISRRVDVLFLAHYWGAEAVGYYAAAVSLAEIILAVSETVSTPFLPIRLGMDDEAGRRFSPLVIAHVLPVMAVICLCAAVAAKPAILVLFGRDFSPSLWPMILLLPGVLALSLYDFLKTDVLGLGRPGFISLVSVAAMVLNLGLNVLLIPEHGPAGAAMASSAAYGLSCVCLLGFVSRKTGTRLAAMLFPGRTERAFLAGRIRSLLDRRRS
ncbi:lipopolysaccharide biosynthesis protein [Desulfolutivibrio sulfoxidireducens]|uniref:lipopolysaccharide biosynthesis protein n=1 Tax=Desulfolutivibrio sulfoxidireducens TaxID=2773299 RepID=UPI00159CFA9F|nr:oligosaccharide flippase family protein [Desulfolutivibrio sulfoxidireducens]QLA14846.1 oligosaccharide flippase family protein [Desulfolutivibrio sulfoxidireducens]QLA18417.1 oligosaccharide flippase family protein [Desulfolutivibrio sulfoxidireducens]